MSDVQVREVRKTAWLEPWAALSPVAVLVGLVLATSVSTEPFFWNDETRHVMTGVFFRDFFADGDWTSPRGYAIRYYLQYPSLGLLVWPPLFYAVEGAVMLAFGPSIEVAKGVVLAFSAIAALYVFALVARTHDRWTAWLASMLFVLSPMILTYSHQVMLEMPALALVLMATYHWMAHLDEGRAWHLWLAAAASCAAVLTRFDAGVLLPTLLVITALRGQWRVLARAQTWCAAALAMVVAAPFVWLTATGVGAVHLGTIVPQSGAGSLAPVLGALAFYLRSLPEQMGWVMLVPALVGIGIALRSATEWRRSIPYISTVICTYVIFTAISERTPRHTIGWIPAVAAFAAIGIASIRRSGTAPAVSWLAALCVMAATGIAAMREPPSYVRGYAQAAEYVVDHTQQSSFTLFDGYYDGNFTYQMRRLDPGRRLWVLRGDKLMYASVIKVGQQYTEFADSDEKMLAVLADYDPELVVVESSPVAGGWTPGAQRLRRVLATSPERYRLERQFPVAMTRKNSNTVLLIYRSLIRNPTPRSSVELDMLTMGGQRIRTPDVNDR